MNRPLPAIFTQLLYSCLRPHTTENKIFLFIFPEPWYSNLDYGNEVRRLAWTLEEGSPRDYSDRLEKEQRCYRMLDGLGLVYWRCDHPDANADTMEQCLAIDSILEAAVCKNLFLCNRQHTEFYLLMMPGEKPFRTKELSSQLGCSRLSFAGPEEMEKYLDITPGSVSVLGLMNDTGHAVRLLVDRDVLEEEFVGCHPCINTSSLKLRGKDLFGPVLRCMDHELTPVTLTGEP